MISFQSKGLSRGLSNTTVLKHQFFCTQPSLWSSSRICRDSPSDSDGKESICNAGDLGLIPRMGRSPGEGNGYPLHYSCLEQNSHAGRHDSSNPRFPARQLFTAFRLKHCFGVRILFKPRRENLSRLGRIYSIPWDAICQWGNDPALLFFWHITQKCQFSPYNITNCASWSCHFTSLIVKYRPWVNLRIATKRKKGCM